MKILPALLKQEFKIAINGFYIVVSITRNIGVIKELSKLRMIGTLSPNVSIFVQLKQKKAHAHDMREEERVRE